MEVCPKKAITWESGRSTIDQEKCIKCGRCVGVCPYNAIVKTERPCAAACGMDSDHIVLSAIQPETVAGRLGAREAAEAAEEEGED